MGWYDNIVYFEAMAGGSDHTHRVPVFVDDDLIFMKPAGLFPFFISFFDNANSSKYGGMWCTGGVFPATGYLIAILCLYRNARGTTASGEACIRIVENIFSCCRFE